MRVSVSDLQKNDVIKFDHKSLNIGSVIGIVVRTYMSGGKAGARVIGSSVGEASSLELHIREGQILELLWREESRVKSATQG